MVCKTSVSVPATSRFLCPPHVAAPRPRKHPSLSLGLEILSPGLHGLGCGTRVSFCAGAGEQGRGDVVHIP